MKLADYCKKVIRPCSIVSCIEKKGSELFKYFIDNDVSVDYYVISLYTNEILELEGGYKYMNKCVRQNICWRDFIKIYYKRFNLDNLSKYQELYKDIILYVKDIEFNGSMIIHLFKKYIDNNEFKKIYELSVFINTYNQQELTYIYMQILYDLYDKSFDKFISLHSYISKKKESIKLAKEISETNTKNLRIMLDNTGYDIDEDSDEDPVDYYMEDMTDEQSDIFDRLAEAQDEFRKYKSKYKNICKIDKVFKSIKIVKNVKTI